MIADFSRPSLPRWLLPVLLTAAILPGLALTAAARYSAPSFLSFWSRPHSLLLRVVIDPVRNRSHAAVGNLRRARDLWQADRENFRLQREIATVAASNQMLREEMNRMRRLTGLEAWGGPPDVALLPADVVGSDSYEGVLLIVNRGRADGVQVGDPAVSLGGLVGKVRSVSTHSAQIQSLTDAQSVVGAVGVGASGMRSRGIVQGRGQNQPLQFIPENEVQPIEPGAVVISSGFSNSIFPKGLVIGVIESRSLDPNGLPFGVIKPSLPPAAVEEVLLVLPVERAHGQGLKPIFNGDQISSTSLLAQALTSSTLANASTTTQSIRLTMPSPAIRQWSAGSTATLELLLGGTLTSDTIAQYFTSATLAVAQANNQAAPATSSTLQAPVPTPAPAPEPPIPSIDAYTERQNNPRGDWPSDWQRGGGE